MLIEQIFVEQRTLPRLHPFKLRAVRALREILPLALPAHMRRKLGVEHSTSRAEAAPLGLTVAWLMSFGCRARPAQWHAAATIIDWGSIAETENMLQGLQYTSH